jgi:NAD-dependent dihydropyrimidine dehydrogenase PreA subunit/nitroreductase
MENGEGFFSVDGGTCVKCGACVRDCAFKALKVGDGGMPEMAAPDKCMRCQHCLAICPVGAVSVDGRAAGDCIDAKGAELPTPRSVINWMSLRRSVRQYRDQDVDPAALDAILSALACSPTGCNAHELTFTCFRTRAAMVRLRKAFIEAVAAPRERMLPRWLAVPAIRMRKGGPDMFFRGAPGLLIVSADPSKPSVATPREDVAIACSNFELLANAHGIATCWCGFLNLVQAEVPWLLDGIAGIPRDHAFNAILFGLPAVRYPRGVARSAQARIVSYDD